MGVGSSGGDISHPGGAFFRCNIKQFCSSCPRVLQALQNCVGIKLSCSAGDNSAVGMADYSYFRPLNTAVYNRTFPPSRYQAIKQPFHPYLSTNLTGSLTEIMLY